jgi:hypothetical protein
MCRRNAWSRSFLDIGFEMGVPDVKFRKLPHPDRFRTALPAVFGHVWRVASA